MNVVPKCRGFRARINPAQNQQAEAELRREIKKEMFGRMKVIGE